MPYYLSSEAELQSIANAIRTKGGTSGQLVYPNGFVSAINAIESKVEPLPGYSSVSSASVQSPFPQTSTPTYSSESTVSMDPDYIYLVVEEETAKEWNQSGYTGKYTNANVRVYFLVYAKYNNIYKWCFNNSDGPSEYASTGIAPTDRSANQMKYKARTCMNYNVTVTIYKGPKIA